MKNWYKKEGYLQFLLGNQWNCGTCQKAGRWILVATWLVYLNAVVFLLEAWPQ